MGVGVGGFGANSTNPSTSSFEVCGEGCDEFKFSGNSGIVDVEFTVKQERSEALAVEGAGSGEDFGGNGDGFG